MLDNRQWSTIGDLTHHVAHTAFFLLLLSSGACQVHFGTLKDHGMLLLDKPLALGKCVALLFSRERVSVTVDSFIHAFIR